jgi:hypothetical protein
MACTTQQDGAANFANDPLTKDNHENDYLVESSEFDNNQSHENLVHVGSKRKVFTRAATTMVSKPSLPQQWLKPNASANQLQHSNSVAPQSSPGIDVECVTKRLFKTPSPKSAKGNTSKSDGKGQYSNSKGKMKMVETMHKKYKQSIIPKVYMS